MTKLEPSQTVAIILSGGAGQRFNGTDKGLTLYRGKPLIQWTIECLTPQVDRILISANRNSADYQKFALEVVMDKFRSDLSTDSNPIYNGPIAGLLSVTKELSVNTAFAEITTRILVAPCDSPNLPSDYVFKLVQALDTSGVNVAVINDGRRRQNLHCLIKLSAIKDLEDFYTEGGRAMHRWFNRISLVDVDFSDQADRFLNINSPDLLD